MNFLKKMSAEVMAQMSVEPDIAENFSPALKKNFAKLGMSAVMAGLLFISNGMTSEAHADNDTRNATMGVAALFGLLSSGSTPKDIPPDCVVEGRSGLKAAAAGVAGAYAGSKMGGGTGNKILTVAGAAAGAMVATHSDDERIRNECAKKIAQTNIPPNYTHRDYIGSIPSYATVDPSPSAPILYKGQTVRGEPYYVTAQSSPGLAALRGEMRGNVSVDTDPMVVSAFNKGAFNLEKAHLYLDIYAQKYTKAIMGETPEGKKAKFAIDPSDNLPDSQVQVDYRAQITKTLQDCQFAYVEYAKVRSLLANLADTAVVLKGYDISAYGPVAEKFTPPPSAAICYQNKMPNKYMVIQSSISP